jgi:predicted nucleic acid-binding protein
MKYLFDTDILIYWLKGNQAIEKKTVAMGLENIRISEYQHIIGE